MFPFLPSVKYPGFHSPAVQQEFEGCIFLSQRGDKSYQASLLLWTLKTNWKKKKNSLLGTYFTSCKGWSRPSTETVKKPNPVTLPPSLQTHWSLKHFQISPTVGSYRPQCPRITQRQMRRVFNTAGRNWMSGFPSVECVIIAVVHRESKRWVPTCQNQAGPLSKRLAGPLLHVPI